MKYEDLRSRIRTGDILGFHGTTLLSRTIELLTGKKDLDSWSHVGVFYWDGPGLWVAQEYEGTGFGCYPASQLIGRFMAERGVCFWGAAPRSVEENTVGVAELIATYRVTPSLRPYGYGSLLKVLFDEHVDPNSVQAVCSIFAQQTWERCGYTFSKLMSPEDFKPLLTDITVIQ